MADNEKPNAMRDARDAWTSKHGPADNPAWGHDLSEMADPDGTRAFQTAASKWSTRK